MTDENIETTEDKSFVEKVVDAAKEVVKKDKKTPKVQKEVDAYATAQERVRAQRGF